MKKLMFQFFDENMEDNSNLDLILLDRELLDKELDELFDNESVWDKSDSREKEYFTDEILDMPVLSDLVG